MEENTATTYKRPPKGFGKVWYILYPILIYFGVTYLVMFVFMVAMAIKIAAETPFADDNLMGYASELGTKIAEAATSNVLIIQLIAYVLLAGLFLLLLIRDVKKRGLFEQKPAKTGILPYVFMFLTVGGYSFFFVALTELTKLYEIFPTMTSTGQAVDESNPIIVILLMCIITPITEELFFRGMIFKRLRGMMSFVPAAIISSIIFGLAHVSVPQIIYTGILAFLWAYIYEKYGSILVTMFCHFVLNTLLMVFGYVLPNAFDERNTVIIIFIVSGAVFIAGLVPLLISLKKMPAVLHTFPKP
ncbi:MAG: CPBP family intramembrane metalloprotease [Ruminococcus sp.]|jgi:membrane protease YdiL (CAAX protease family)|nr:CPBP family intramembrane metalloprotease [Ruminococcus sp.]